MTTRKEEIEELDRAVSAVKYGHAEAWEQDRNYYKSEIDYLESLPIIEKAARAHLEQLRREEDGWVMVPKEPTEKMIYEGVNASFALTPDAKLLRENAGSIYVAMLAASQERKDDGR